MPARKHRLEDAVRAALDLLDENGLDALSVRAVAKRMRVNVNTVSSLVGTKSSFLALVSDALLADLSLDDLPQDGEEKAKEVLRRYRRALLSCRDGARLTASNEPTGDKTLILTETLVEALSAAGLTDRQVADGMWTLLYFLFGLTSEQQAVANRSSVADSRLASGDYPTLLRLREFAASSFDERFEFGVESIICSLRTGAAAH